jgi:hypothetical protein
MIIPEWIMELKQNSLLNSKEVAGLMGITVNALDKRIAKNSFPKADASIKNIMFGVNRNTRSYWHVKTVINHMKSLS